jgi:NADH-quinone oxidoreductase subunit L
VLAPALSFVITLLAGGDLIANTPQGTERTFAGDAGVPAHPLAPAFVMHLWTWFSAGTFHLEANLLFDALTAMMLLFVTGIGTLIHLYSVGYMWSDRGFARFMAYLNLFMFSMIMLVMGGSLPVTFLGWEGVGLCSYLLVGFWHHNTDYNDAARKAFVMNRIGDLGFLLGAFVLLNTVGSLDYRAIAEWFAVAGDQAIANASSGLGIAGLLIFFGCTGKSAQIPLLTWLPDAMAGPTPVSALIHAATMVTSGVYLVARLGDVYVHAPAYLLTTILVIGCLTAVFGAIAGLFQNDIKKALAYSTVSQLGFMFMAAGAGAFDVALFHVFTHAFFKATLFLGAGAVIHSLHHEQDMRKMGGLATTWSWPRSPVHRKLFIAFMAMAFGWWAIIGLPLGSGFMSKDLILERLATGTAQMGPEMTNLAPIIGNVALLTALVTAIYMTRVMVLTFWSPERLSEETKHHLTGTPVTMAVPLVILGVGSLIAGFVWFDLMGVKDFETWLAPVLGPAQAAHHAAVSHGEAGGAEPAWLVPLKGSLAAILGLIIAFVLWGRGPRGALTGELSGFGKAWTFAFDTLYNWTVAWPVYIISLVVFYLGERVLIAGPPNLLAIITEFVGESYASLQQGRLRVSLGLSVAGVVALLWLDQLTALSTWCLNLLHLSSLL